MLQLNIKTTRTDSPAHAFILDEKFGDSKHLFLIVHYFQKGFRGPQLVYILRVAESDARLVSPCWLPWSTLKWLRRERR